LTLQVDGLNQKAYSSGAYDMGANVILIHVGTNDCWWIKNETGAGAATRIGYLLDSIKTRAPEALVLASTLIKNTNDWEDKCIRGFNTDLPAVVDEAAAKGQQVRLVDMYPVVPLDQIQADGTHPTDYGYQLMARQWFDAMVNATRDLCVEQAANTTSFGAGTPSANPSGQASGSAQSDSSTQSASEASGLSSNIALWSIVIVAVWALPA
jgi:hypothetical protein